MGALPTLLLRSTAGVKANGDSYGSGASANGRYGLFASDASNLYDDTNGTRDVFRVDLLTGAVVAVNVLPNGLVESSASFKKSASFLGASGDKVLFSSDSALYLRNVAAGSTIQLVAQVAQDNYPLQWAPGQWNYPNFSASPSGRYVAFASPASTLVRNDGNGLTDIFVLDLTTQATTRVSTSSASVQANGNSLHPVFSKDEAWVQFSSYATNLYSPGGAVPDTAKGDVFLKNLATGELRAVSHGLNATATNGHSFGQGFTTDGKFALFDSEASNLVAGDTNGASDVFAYEIATGRVTRLSTGASNEQANGGSGFASAVPGSDIVSFVSSASNLVARDTNDVRDVFFKQPSTSKIASFKSVGLVQPNDETLTVGFSADGAQAYISTKASNLVAGDTDHLVDVLAVPTTQIISFLTRTGTGAQGFRIKRRACG